VIAEIFLGIIAGDVVMLLHFIIMCMFIAYRLDQFCLVSAAGIGTPASRTLYGVSTNQRANYSEGKKYGGEMNSAKR
jgi:hypothetical protein